jgi:SnoaL-like domain
LKNSLHLALLVAVIAGSVWLWRIMFPSDETVIRRQLQELAVVASFPPNEAPLAKLTNAARLANFFTADGEVDIAPWNYQRVIIKGRDEIRQAAVGARNAVMSLSVTTEDVEIVSGPTKGRATVRLILTGRTSQDAERRSQPMHLDLRKVDGDWLIQRITTEEYLTQ